MLDAKLIVVGGVADQKEVTLKSLPLTIGRGREAALTLSHSLVSRSHCKIFADNGLLQVEDLNSLNGTYVNNKKIDGIQTLEPGQLLTLGNVTFRAIYGTKNEQGQTALPNEPASSSDTDASGMEYDTDHDKPPIGLQEDTDWVSNVAPVSEGKPSEDKPAAAINADSFRIDVGESLPKKVDDAALDSFIRKAR